MAGDGVRKQRTHRNAVYQPEAFIRGKTAVATVSWPSNRSGDPLDWGLAQVGTCAWKEENLGLTMACTARRVCGCVKREGGEWDGRGWKWCSQFNAGMGRAAISPPLAGPQVALPVMSWS